MVLALEYYEKARKYWNKADCRKSLFYFGAVLHLIQDVTIPQHANIRLLDDHRQFENFVKRTYQYIDAFQAIRGAYLLSSVENFIKFNARTALKIYKKFWQIENDERRFYRITRCTLPLAERTTAGAMIMFYDQVVRAGSNEKISVNRG